MRYSDLTSIATITVALRKIEIFQVFKQANEKIIRIKQPDFPRICLFIVMGGFCPEKKYFT